VRPTSKPRLRNCLRRSYTSWPGWGIAGHRSGLERGYPLTPFGIADAGVREHHFLQSGEGAIRAVKIRSLDDAPPPAQLAIFVARN
jgi:hypothetical protein